MYFFPFLYRKYFLTKSCDEILSVFKEKVFIEDSINKYFIFLGFPFKIDAKFSKKTFLLGRDLSDFKSKFSYWPAIKGWINADNNKTKTSITIIISPFIGAILTLLFGWGLSIIGIYIFYEKKQYGDFSSLLLFALTFYVLLMYAFNKGAKQYIKFIEKEIIG